MNEKTCAVCGKPIPEDKAHGSVECCSEKCRKFIRGNIPDAAEIPDNIAKWLTEHNGANFSININSADQMNGYAHIIFYSVIISMLTRTCHNCGYDPIWRPDDEDSKCQRHSYNNWRYDVVFAYSPRGTKLTLEKAFDKWLDLQPKEYAYDKPMVKMEYGKIGTLI